MTPKNHPLEDTPDLSIILLTADRFEPIRKTVRAFARQTVRDRLELLIVCPSEEKLGMPKEEVNGFHSVRVISIPNFDRTSAARVEAIRVARAPIVALAEDHAYPEPGYAEALINAHKGPWAGVGPALINANPGIVSWIAMLADYGRWTEPVQGGVIDDIPGHNSSWKRALLLDYGARLETILPAPTILNWDLQRRGYQLYLEPAAKARHVQVSSVWPCIVEQYNVARMFPAERGKLARDKKLFYVCGMPVLLMRNLRGWMRNFRRVDPSGKLLIKALPMLLLFTIVWGLGEIAGYIAGIGRAQEATLCFDTDRCRYVNRRDRRILAAS